MNQYDYSTKLCAHPVVKKCTLEALDLLALHNMKGRVHAVNHKQKKSRKDKPEPCLTSV